MCLLVLPNGFVAVISVGARHEDYSTLTFGVPGHNGDHVSANMSVSFDVDAVCERGCRDCLTT